MFYLFVMSAVAFPSIIGASVAVLYKKNSPQNGVDIAQCGRLAFEFGFCGARVNSGVCEPLTTDWCITKPMLPCDVYLVKDIVIDKIQEPAVNVYDRQLPMPLNEGSGFELKLTAHSDWVGTQINLYENAGNAGNRPLHISLRANNIILFNTIINNNWSSEVKHTHFFPVDVDTTMTIVCGTNGFEMYVDGIQKWTFPYRQPAFTARSIKFSTSASKMDLHQITFKAA